MENKAHRELRCSTFRALELAFACVCGSLLTGCVSTVSAGAAEPIPGANACSAAGELQARYAGDPANPGKLVLTVQRGTDVPIRIWVDNRDELSLESTPVCRADVALLFAWFRYEGGPSDPTGRLLVVNAIDGRTLLDEESFGKPVIDQAEHLEVIRWDDPNRWTWVDHKLKWPTRYRWSNGVLAPIALRPQDLSEFRTALERVLRQCEARASDSECRYREVWRKKLAELADSTQTS